MGSHRAGAWRAALQPEWFLPVCEAGCHQKHLNCVTGVTPWTLKTTQQLEGRSAQRWRERSWKGGSWKGGSPGGLYAGGGLMQVVWEWRVSLE
jgi:hypothetical protein